MKMRMTIAAALMTLASPLFMAGETQAVTKDFTLEKNVLIANEEPAKEAKPRIELAILLDTSGSMEGLINQARTELWRVVNEFAATRKNGVVPEIRVALYEYGKQTVPAQDGYIRLILPLTTDLDKISEQMFALTTNGGEEFCGMVIKTAVDKLEWTPGNENLKVIIIAGNEPFTQGPINFRESCKAAIEKGIIINTIHCGPNEEDGWKDGALLADGRFMNIDQNQAVVHIPAPQDKQLAQLAEEMRKTYIPFGSKGEAGAARQANSVAKAAEAMQPAEQAKAMTNQQYKNDQWDLVDAVKENADKLKDVKEEELPDAMKKMTADERKVYVEKFQQKRAELQSEIQKLAAERDKFVEAERKKLGDKDNSFGAALIKAVSEQAQKKNFVKP